MNWLYFLTITVTSIILVNNVVNTLAKEEEEARTLFKNILERRRHEQFLLQKNLDSGKFGYDQKFRLLKVAIDKVFELIIEHKSKLLSKKLHASDKTLSESIVIENCLLLIDFFMNFNDIIYIALDKTDLKWFELFKWSFEFTKNYDQMFDEVTYKQFQYIKKNIKEVEHREPLENPFENNLKQFQDPEAPKTKPKPKKSIKSKQRGPKLSAAFGDL